MGASVCVSLSKEKQCCTTTIDNYCMKHIPILGDSSSKETEIYTQTGWS